MAAGAAPSLGPPRELFKWEAAGRGFDVTADGQRFVMVEETDPGAPGPRIAVVQNWAAEFTTEK